MPSNVSPLQVSFALAATFGLLSAQAPVTYSDELMPGSEEPGWLVFRVVDDLSSAPVAGAEVFLVGESVTPIAGEFPFQRKGISDDQGVVRIPVADIGPRWEQVLRHPKQGTCSRGPVEGPVWRVGRGFDVPVLVTDWRGQPAPGATIGLCGGCGHSPDLVNAVADVRGIATLPNVDPHNHVADIYVQHPGLGLGYDSIDWYPGGPPALARCDWSIPLTGTVVDHSGAPVPDVFVGALDVHRGPWARTAADGTFTILGGDPGTGAYHVRTAAGRKFYFETPASYPVTLKLPDDDPEAYEGTTDVGDGWEMPPLELRKVRVRFETSGERLEASVLLPGRSPLDAVDDTIQVPTTGPFAVCFAPEESGGLPWSRFLAFDDVSALPTEPLLLKWFSPTRVVGRVVDGDGAPVPVRVSVGTDWSRNLAPSAVDCDTGSFELPVRDTGMRVLVIEPRRDDLRRRVVWLPLPLRGDDVVVDLGDIVLATEPQLVAFDSEGPLEFGKLSWARAGYQQVDRWHDFDLDYEGGWQGPDLRAGDVVMLEGEGDELPFRTVLEGDGPWRIEAPVGQLDVRVRAAAGELVVPTIAFADQVLQVKDVRRLRRLRQGPLRLWAMAPGHRTAVIDVVVGAEPQSIEVTLPAR